MYAALGNSQPAPAGVSRRDHHDGQPNAILMLLQVNEVMSLLVQHGTTKWIATTICDVLQKHGGDHGLADLKEALLMAHPAQSTSSPKQQPTGGELSTAHSGAFRTTSSPGTVNTATVRSPPPPSLLPPLPPTPGLPSRPVSPVTQSEPSDTARLDGLCAAMPFPVPARLPHRRANRHCQASSPDTKCPPASQDGCLKTEPPADGDDAMLDVAYAIDRLPAYATSSCGGGSISAFRKLARPDDGPNPPSPKKVHTDTSGFSGHSLDASPMKISSLLSANLDHSQPKPKPAKEPNTTHSPHATTATTTSTATTTATTSAAAAATVTTTTAATSAATTTTTTFARSTPKKTSSGINVCHECNRTFSRVTDMRRHMKNCHSELRPYHCFCGKNFKRSDILMRHQRTNACRPL